MCMLKELVQVVPDESLCVSWMTATGDDGQRVVFVRHSDQWLIQHYCGLGEARCPVRRAFATA